VGVTAATAGATTGLGVLVLLCLGSTATTSTAAAATCATTSLGVLVLLCLGSTAATTATCTSTTTSACAGEVRVGDYKSAALQAIDVVNA
jgi:uracil-DNA glycosylase